MVTFFGPWNLGRLLGDTFGVYSKKWFYYIAIVTPFCIAIALAYWALFPTIEHWYLLTESYDVTDPASFRALFFFTGYFLLLLLICLIIYEAMSCFFIHAMVQQYTTGNLSVGKAFTVAIKRSGSALLATLLRNIVVLALMITTIGIPLAIYLYIRWLFLTQATLLEGKNLSEALSRSSQLVSENWWRVLGYVIVTLIIVLAVIYIMGFIDILITSLFNFSLIFNGFDFGFTIVIIIAAPIYVIATTLLYFSLRVEKEGYHLGKLKNDMDAWDANKRPIYITDVADSAVGQFYCSRCGTRQGTGARFCSNCGRSFYGDTPPPQADDKTEHGDGSDGPFIK